MFKINEDSKKLRIKKGDIAYFGSDVTNVENENTTVTIPAGSVFRVCDVKLNHKIHKLEVEIEDVSGNQTTISSRRIEYLQQLFNVIDNEQINDFNDDNKRIYDNFAEKFNHKNYENSKLWAFTLPYILLFFVLLYFAAKIGFLIVPIMVLMAFIIINCIIFIHYFKVKKNLPKNYPLYENYEQNKREIEDFRTKLEEN